MYVLLHDKSHSVTIVVLLHDKSHIVASLIQNAWVPLMYAVKNGHWTTVKALLESGHIETFVMNKVHALPLS